jgi:tetratricopeptide (TPR) repeat protein
MHARRTTGALAALAAGAALALPLGGCGLKALSHPFGAGSRTAAQAQPAKGKPAKGQSTKGQPAHGSMAEARARAIADPGQAYWPFHEAELLLAADSVAPAEASLKAALARDPGYAPALALLSKLWFRAGRHEEAIRLLDAARADASRFPKGFPPELAASLALHDEAIGRPDLAARAMAGVPRSRAGSVGVLVTLRGDAPDSAAAPALALVRDDPKSAANQNNAGIVRLRGGDPEAAEKAFRRAIEIDPSLPGPYYNLAILAKFYRLDDAAAARWYREYRTRSSDDPDGLAQVFAPAQEKPVAEKKD